LTGETDFRTGFFIFAFKKKEEDQRRESRLHFPRVVFAFPFFVYFIFLFYLFQKGEEERNGIQLTVQ